MPLHDFHLVMTFDSNMKNVNILLLLQIHLKVLTDIGMTNSQFEDILAVMMQFC